MEGAEAIDPNFELLDVLYEAGLRSLGPVWSRSNAFSPFSIRPASPPAQRRASMELAE
jgi:microsomal dipeptidase-like Zn-dependent dipeptidase